MISRARGFWGTDDTAGFIDPDALRDVDHAVKRGDAMININQRPIGCVRLFDPGTGVFSSAAFLCDGYYGKILGLQAVEQFLPHGQVKAAASPGRPGGEEHLLPPQIREPVLNPVEVGQREIRRFRAGELL